MKRGRTDRRTLTNALILRDPPWNKGIQGGSSAVPALVVLARRNWFGPGYYTPVEMTGLYWHFVDLVWIFLFPLLYLI